MTAAPVGFQCPECVAAGAAAVKTTRKRGGALAQDERPLVSWSIVGICVAVYLVQMVVGVNQVASSFGMQPLAIGVLNEWYRLLTSVFLHGSVLHIMFNMYVLIVLGPTLERLLGHGRFLVLFLVAGLGGSITSYWLSSPTSLSVGASGAIFGLMGALLVAGRRLRADVTQVVVLIAINLAIGFIFGGIDWRAHVGGLVTGAAMAAVMVGVGGHRPRKSVEYGGIAGIIGVLFVIFTIHTAQLMSLTG
jgi:membrane associated rhomboid family serine protease